MSDTSIRYLSMLSHIPARPQKITAGELCARLAAENFNTHKRSIERDLHKLSRHFPLRSDEAKPAGWSWGEGGSRITFPPMSLTAALTCELLARYLAPVLPRAMRQQLAPAFAEARRILDDHAALPVGKWSKRIAVLPPGQQLLPPEIPKNVSDVVYDALLNGKRFEANYMPLGSDARRRYVFNPQGLVYRQGAIYLVANLFDYDNVLQFALHRMSSVTPLDEAATELKGFDLQRYIREEKAFDLPTGKNIRLELRIAPWLARHLGECRLATDQTITPIRGSEAQRLAATVADTEQLQWWLRSFGPEVEVLRPASLRRKMAENAVAAAAVYNNAP